MGIMSKLRKSTGSADTSASEPIEAVMVDSALGMFRDMLLEEYTRRIADGGNSSSVKSTLASHGIRFEVLFKSSPQNSLPRNPKLLDDRINNELSYITNNYYDLFASYRRLSATLDVLYAYSDADASVQYKNEAKKYLEALSKLTPGKIYDEQVSLQKQAIGILRGIIDGALIAGFMKNGDDEINDARALSIVAFREMEELKRDIDIITGYIDTYKSILEMTLHELGLYSKKRTSWNA